MRPLVRWARTTGKASTLCGRLVGFVCLRGTAAPHSCSARLRGSAARREQFGWAGEDSAGPVAEPAESEGTESRVGSVVVDVAGVARRVEGFGERSGADVVLVVGDVWDCGERASTVDGHGRGEEVHGGVVEGQVLGVSARQFPDEALGNGDAMGADDCGESGGVRERELVVEGARSDGTGCDRVAEERIDQRQIIDAGGAVAVGQSLDVGGVGRGRVEGGGLGHRLGAHGAHVRTRSGLVFESEVEHQCGSPALGVVRLVSSENVL